MSSHEQHFLAVCDLLCSSDAATISFNELFQWSSYIIEKPVRPLYANGRLLFIAFEDAWSRPDFDAFRKVACAVHFQDGAQTPLARFLKVLPIVPTEARSLWSKISDSIRQSVLPQIDITQVNAYRVDVANTDALSRLGSIMETLGRHSDILLTDPAHGKLIIDYVSVFMEKAGK